MPAVASGAGRSWGEIVILSGAQKTLRFTNKDSSGAVVPIVGGDTFQLWARNTRDRNDVFGYGNDQFTVVGDGSTGQLEVVLQSTDTLARFGYSYDLQLWKTSTNNPIGYGVLRVLKSAIDPDDAAIIDNIPSGITGFVVGTGLAYRTGIFSDLSTLLGVSPSADKVPYYTGTASAALSSLTTFGRQIIGTANAGALQTLAGLVIGTNVQTHSSNLDSWSAVAPSAYATNFDAAGAAAAITAGSLGLGTGDSPTWAGGTFSDGASVGSGGTLLLGAFAAIQFAVGGVFLSESGLSVPNIAAGTATFTGPLSASNLSGTNTGDQDLSTLAPLIGSTINAQSGTSYALVLSDAGKLVTLSNASAITLTVPHSTTAAILSNSRVDLIQIGAGQVTISPASGVTVNSKGSALKITGQHSGATLIKIAANTWELVGDLSS